MDGVHADKESVSEWICTCVVRVGLYVCVCVCVCERESDREGEREREREREGGKERMNENHKKERAPHGGTLVDVHHISDAPSRALRKPRDSLHSRAHAHAKRGL